MGRALHPVDRIDFRASSFKVTPSRLTDRRMNRDWIEGVVLGEGDPAGEGRVMTLPFEGQRLVLGRQRHQRLADGRSCAA